VREKEILRAGVHGWNGTRAKATELRRKKLCDEEPDRKSQHKIARTAPRGNEAHEQQSEILLHNNRTRFTWKSPSSLPYLIFKNKN
jgi:hypothetical protein